MSGDDEKRFLDDLEELCNEYHSGTYESGLELVRLLRKKADEMFEQVRDDMTLPD